MNEGTSVGCVSPACGDGQGNENDWAGALFEFAIPSPGGLQPAAGVVVGMFSAVHQVQWDGSVITGPMNVFASNFDATMDPGGGDYLQSAALFAEWSGLVAEYNIDNGPG